MQRTHSVSTYLSLISHYVTNNLLFAKSAIFDPCLYDLCRCLTALELSARGHIQHYIVHPFFGDIENDLMFFEPREHVGRFDL